MIAKLTQLLQAKEEEIARMAAFVKAAALARSKLGGL